MTLKVLKKSCVYFCSFCIDYKLFFMIFIISARLHHVLNYGNWSWCSKLLQTHQHLYNSLKTDSFSNQNKDNNKHGKDNDIFCLKNTVTTKWFNAMVFGVVEYAKKLYSIQCLGYSVMLLLMHVRILHIT